MKVGALRAAAIQAVQAAIDAHKLADKLEDSWQEQKQSWQEQKQSWQEQKESWQEQEKLHLELEEALRSQIDARDGEILRLRCVFTARGVFEHAAYEAHNELRNAGWQKQEQGWQKQEKLHLELKKVLFSQIDMRDAEILRLRCVFTARGVFEHAAYEAHDELRNAGTDVPAPRVGERFVATQALQAVQRHGDFLHKQPVGFTWCKRLLTAHKQCATDEHQTMTLSEIYGVLSVFTARGVFEHATFEAHRELRQAQNDVPAPRVGKRLVATQTLQAVQRLGDVLREQPVGFRWCKRLLTAHKQCATDEHQTMTLSEIYGVLSQQIHGHPWSGESVLMSDKLQPFPRCVVASIAEQAGYGCQVGNVLPEEPTLEETS
eukprot:CAMPEP_0195040242 /NCGR_PEP_ID=MMETSP0326_2-20130528/80225_1 /TAXON_ID=2866 ORGANISM="Crypthecodinium cohnii, Strain Seligo" /NCGR_SAMPLE_ID=MMETSP0326_2 /ASSEMBLY_ACC=CAM_ASM_000348 /LENGTH=375 /DNA_ID=CAMNT_0040067143 /DNA_START=169 /DNA_END=1296 /DNA_ORIENTATION=+